MYHLTVEGSFDAAHRLQNYQGDCANLHGHRYVIQVTVSGEELDDLGMVVDFKRIKEVLNNYIGELDHALLCPPDRKNDVYRNKAEIFSPNPTAEVIAWDAFQHFKAEGINPTKVKLWETPGCSVTYEE